MFFPMKVKLAIAIVFILILIVVSILNSKSQQPTLDTTYDNDDTRGGLVENEETHPLQIEQMRKKTYPGSEIIIEQTIETSGNYSQYITSYKSEGLKIYGLLTIPNGEKPEKGWPVIIFNHGYIPPAEYRTTERYIAYVDGFARNGYIVFKSDYRGHGNSEGNPSGGYGSPDYTIDILNAVSSVKRLKDPQSNENIVDPSRIGMWGHSMGGSITLRSMVISKDIKAGVIWAGVVASYPDLLSRWRRSPTNTPAALPTGARRWRQTLMDRFGTPEQNPDFWKSISANSYVADISGPIQLHHGTADESVPYQFSESLKKDLDSADKSVELYLYDGAEHNLTAPFNTAMQRSVAFFDKYLKNT